MRVYSTPFEIIQFYYFWLWEYQRRNEEYIKDFDDLQRVVKESINREGLNTTNRKCAIYAGVFMSIQEKKGEAAEKVLEAIEDFEKKYYRKYQHMDEEAVKDFDDLEKLVKGSLKNVNVELNTDNMVYAEKIRKFIESNTEYKAYTVVPNYKSRRHEDGSRFDTCEQTLTFR